MTRFCALFSVLLAVLMMIPTGHSWTWFPDPQRGARLQARWNRYKALPDKTTSEVEKICGKMTLQTCQTAIGRPTDYETESCDSFCCHKGYLTGFCNGNNGGCACTNDQRDARCGPDGSFAGIRCPADRSACARKCCREGGSGGRCGGFLWTKCKCA